MHAFLLEIQHFHKMTNICFASIDGGREKKVHVHGVAFVISERSLFLYSPFGLRVYTSVHTHSARCAHVPAPVCQELSKGRASFG